MIMSCNYQSGKAAVWTRLFVTKKSLGSVKIKFEITFNLTPKMSDPKPGLSELQKMSSNTESPNLLFGGKRKEPKCYNV